MESKRHQEGELSILRNTIRELKREKVSAEELFKKDVESRRERHDMEVRRDRVNKTTVNSKYRGTAPPPRGKDPLSSTKVLYRGDSH